MIPPRPLAGEIEQQAPRKTSLQPGRSVHLAARAAEGGVARRAQPQDVAVAPTRRSLAVAFVLCVCVCVRARARASTRPCERDVRECVDVMPMSALASKCARAPNTYTSNLLTPGTRFEFTIKTKKHTFLDHVLQARGLVHSFVLVTAEAPNGGVFRHPWPACFLFGFSNARANALASRPPTRPGSCPQKPSFCCGRRAIRARGLCLHACSSLRVHFGDGGRKIFVACNRRRSDSKRNPSSWCPRLLLQ